MATERIKLVAGDNLPIVKFQLLNADGSPMDVSSASVAVAFRAEGATAVLATLACTNVSTGTDGWVKFNFPGSTLNVPAGNYEGEVEITFPGPARQTVYDPLRFTVRSKFA